MLMISIILMTIGILMFIKPDIFWHITESWKSDMSYGPSDLYLFSTKFGGVILFIVGFITILIRIFL